jgi:hypothetical protein
MLAIAAAICFIVALVIHVAGVHDAARLVTDFGLAGLALIALALVFGGWAPWVRPRP